MGALRHNRHFLTYTYFSLQNNSQYTTWKYSSYFQTGSLGQQARGLTAVSTHGKFLHRLTKVAECSIFLAPVIIRTFKVHNNLLPTDFTYDICRTPETKERNAWWLMKVLKVCVGYHLQVTWPLYYSSRFCPDSFLPNFLLVGLLTCSCLLLRHRRRASGRVLSWSNFAILFRQTRFIYGIEMANADEDVWSKKCRVLKRKCDELEQNNSVLYGKFLKIQKIIEDAEREKR